ncbi:MAG: tRNA lysidine(34) synthetase TilS [Victivallaceae bacterium]|nr:tRNA lysidine(34) synthetase TilS [Victivallaceae bacterium]
MDFDKIRTELAGYQGYTIYVGFSGGADSTALLLLLQQVSAELEIELRAVHFEHGLRGAVSIADADWCADFCALRGIHFQCISLGLSKDIPNLEAVAREKRLEQWTEVVGNGNSDKSVVALAHHADDRVENMLIRLCRGSNVSGLSSLRFAVKIGEVNFIRPLIEVSRVAIIEFLHAEEIAWREDETNAIAEFTRNFFRNRILPEIYLQLEYAKDGMKHAASALTIDADFIEQSANASYSEIISQNSTPGAFWRKLHPALLPRILRYWMNDNGLNIIPDRDLVERFSGSLKYAGHEARFIPLRRGGFIQYGSDEYRLVKKQPTTVSIPETVWRWRDGSLEIDGMTLTAEEVSGLPEKFTHSSAIFDAGLIPDELIICSWQSGDRMVPFGAHSTVKLKKLFTDRKISAENRSQYPIIRLAGRKIIWVAGLRRSNFAPGCAGKNIRISIANDI